MQLTDFIAEIPNFPKPGINFKDMSPLLTDPAAFDYVIQQICARHQTNKPDKIVGLDARGFIFGAPVAHQLGVGLVMCRKSGKLPGKTIAQSYDLEYGSNTFEIQAAALAPGDSILVIDDLLATGGSLEAVCALIKKLGAEVAHIECIMELAFLGGRERLKPHHVSSLIVYD